MNDEPDGSGEPSSKTPDDSDLPGIAAFAVMGMTSAVCVGVGVVLGLWVDHLAHVAPAGLLIGIVLGTVAAVAGVIQQVRRFL